MELNLNDIWALMRKKLWLFAAIVFISGALSLGISKFIIPPKYTSDFEVSIDFRTSAENGSIGSYTVQYHLNKYIKKVSGDSFLDDVSSRLEEKEIIFGKESLRKSIAIDKNSDISFKIKVTTSDIKLTDEIARTISDTIATGGKFLEQTDRTSINKIEVSIAPRPVVFPSSPNVLLNTIVGLMLGAALAVVLIILIDKIDTTIKDEHDLERNFDNIILGVIYEHKLETGDKR